MVTDAAFTFDRFAQPHLDDPYPLYEQARERAGVFYADAFGMWVVTGHDDVRQVLSDPARFSSAYLIRTPLAPAAGVTEILREGYPEVRVLLNQDPPEHIRTRSLAAKAFAPRRVRRPISPERACACWPTRRPSDERSCWSGPRSPISWSTGCRSWSRSGRHTARRCVPRASFPTTRLDHTAIRGKAMTSVSAATGIGEKGKP